MLVSSEDKISQGRIVEEIGPITATSEWRGGSTGDELRSHALARLIAAAQDFEADAIVGLRYMVDSVAALDLTAVSLQRISVTGIAVKLARAA